MVFKLSAADTPAVEPATELAQSLVQQVWGKYIDGKGVVLEKDGSVMIYEIPKKLELVAFFIVGAFLVGYGLFNIKKLLTDYEDIDVARRVGGWVMNGGMLLIGGMLINEVFRIFEGTPEDHKIFKIDDQSVECYTRSAFLRNGESVSKFLWKEISKVSVDAFDSHLIFTCTDGKEVEYLSGTDFCPIHYHELKETLEKMLELMHKQKGIS